ncbi:family 43 glycosylhydrolase [Formosa haliotis]|uniref:family 43 glycosylhydrolase n=1 Tax=Formosa haliotis TaxID=1555194 RepID=UPI0008242DB2|nr:family 43 glycosylhydrolase [Formosa haliotis]
MKPTTKLTALHLILICLSLQMYGQKRQGIEEKDYTAYLFTYFTGNKQSQEQIHFAVSQDGYHFKALNNNQPVINSETISSSGGVRDPHILRSEDGKTFYMVATDMVTSKGWDSNRAFVMLKSTDLIHWTHSVIHIPKKYGGHEDLKRVWAPQTVFDHEAKKYLIYWSMKHGDANDIIYYAYTNDDFTDIIGEPKPLFIPKSGDFCIDGDIIFKDDIYYMYYKTGTLDNNGLRMAKTRSLTSNNWIEFNDFVESTKEDVEGSGLFKLNNSEDYILMYDVYRKHQYQFTRTTDFQNFEIVDQDIQMDFQPRHGTVISITNNELKALTKTYGIPEGLAPIPNNPVLQGYYADPDIMYSEKNKKFYMYPTSDGFNEWSGTYFEAFSSDNLVDWNNEGVILDLEKDVSWTNTNAWAPCIIEKKTKSGYKYYYYFTAGKFIGVATADEPEGPFKDSGKRIIDKKPEGTNRGIEIDPEVFHDPVSNKDYLYYGNGYMAVAELKPNMTEIDESSIKLLNPSHYREGTTVFYRNGIYYFLWSENDTRHVNYRIRYATSNSPTGPLHIPEDNIILAKDPSQGIYATGHNSVIQVPGKDAWYIVYHRFSYPNGINIGRAAGYHREVCIDTLKFNADGSIKPTKPTHTGIKPIQLN